MTGPERPSDEKVLQVLGLFPLPLSTAYIAEELGVSTRRAHQVCCRLADEGRVLQAEVGGRCAGGGAGRPTSMWQLVGQVQPAPELCALIALFSPGTRAVTPSNREVRVVGVDRTGFADCEYLDVEIYNSTIHVSNLSAFQPGRTRPIPVRRTA